MHHAGDAEHGVAAVEQGLDDVAHGHGDGIEGRALALDDLAAGGADVVLDLIQVQLCGEVLAVVQVLAVVGKAHRGDAHGVPRHEGAVAVLTQHEGVHVLVADGEALGDAGAQARAVQQRAGADDAVLRDAGDAVEGVGQHVHRIADEHVQRVRRVLHDLGRDGLEDVDVDLAQLQAGLTGLAGNAGRDDDDVGARGVLIAAGVDLAGLHKRRALADVHGLAQRLLGVDVDHHDLRNQALHGHRICDGGTHAARADDGYFIAHAIHLQCAIDR